jgi:hypothetical protein
MKPVEIRDTTWKTFCEEFTRLHQGTLITIEMLDGNGERVEVARDIPLDRMVLDQNSACSDVLTVNASEAGKRGIDHLIIEPIHLILRENTDHTKILQITAENGTTLITFHSGQMATSSLGPAAVERCVL